MLLLLRGNDYTKYMFKIPFCCILVRYVFEDSERYVCFFAETSTAHHHNVVLRRTHTHTHSHTHTHDGPTVAARSSGSRFFGFCKYFLTTCGQQEFFLTDRGHVYPKKISRLVNVFSYLCMYFLTQALCCTYEVMLGKLLIQYVKLSCWK